MSNEIIVQAETVDGVPTVSVEIVYQCKHCASPSAKDKPRCATCGMYNGMVPVPKTSVRFRPVPVIPLNHKPMFEDPQAATGLAQAARQLNVRNVEEAPTKLIADLSADENGMMQTGEDQLDYVLGGGIPTPSVVLLAGDPGVGKSRLTTRIMAHLAKSYDCLYGSGEEHEKAIGLRAKKMGIVCEANRAHMHVKMGTSVKTFLDECLRLNVKWALMDSIQVYRDDDLGPDVKPGSVKMLESIAKKVHTFCHANDMSIWIVCHITKAGDFSGPKAMEHHTDANAMLTKLDNGQVSLVLTKSRFGSTDVAGIFEHTDQGLVST